MSELGNVLPPDHTLYAEAIEALRRYHDAELAGVSSHELERLRLLAESAFQMVTDYQLRALGGPSITTH